MKSTAIARTLVAIAMGAAVVTPLRSQPALTEITKWQDGRDAAVSLTFDDSTENHFRIAVPLLDERGMHGTFFVITSEIPGSRYAPTFVGRPIMDIIRESARTPTTEANVLERTSMLRYLADVQRVAIVNDFSAQRLGRMHERRQFDQLLPAVDALMAKLRASGATYAVTPVSIPGRYNQPPWSTREGVSWADFRRYAAAGHEFGSHTVSHPYLSALDEANNMYEIEKSLAEMREQLGPAQTFSIECPNGTGDVRMLPYTRAHAPLARNWVTDEFMDGIMRGDSRDPASSTRPYVQWQRGALTNTSMDTMTGWLDRTADHGVWLVLVFHGIEGIGWESLSTERVRTYFDEIKRRESRLWIATYRDAAKYARERMAATVASTRTGETIDVTVRHSLDPALYDLPLTARTTVPDDWKTVRFKQGSDERWLPVVHAGPGRAHVTYRVKPDGSAITLQKGRD